MKITKYVDWFHDGELREFRHIVSESRLVVTMLSAQIIGWEEFDNKIELSKNFTICGVLSLEGVKKITINKKIFNEELKLLDEYGEILDFEIEDDQKVTFGIYYHGLAKTNPDLRFQTIEIECESHSWENIPSLDTGDY